MKSSIRIAVLFVVSALSLGCAKERVLLEKESRLLNNEWSSCEFTLDNLAQVKLSLSVLSGNGVTLFLLDNYELKRYSDLQKTLYDGKFAHYEAFHQDNKKQAFSSAQLAPGKYMLVAREGSPLRGSAAESAVARIRLVAE
ncbi:MAG: hypothetical protein WC969_09935 [Elusimicrobiota bacterium]|jgi:hypothetical protein